MRRHRLAPIAFLAFLAACADIAPGAPHASNESALQPSIELVDDATRETIHTIARRINAVRCNARWTFFADYDGTLQAESESGAPAAMDQELVDLIQAASVTGEVHIVTARKRLNVLQMMEPIAKPSSEATTGEADESIRTFPIALHASYGLWSRAANASTWSYNSNVATSLEEPEWKQLVADRVREQLSSWTTDSAVEKEGALQWQLNSSGDATGMAFELQKQIKTMHLSSRPLSSILSVQVSGATVRVRLIDIDKSVPIRQALARAGASSRIAIAVGDDEPDEVMFRLVQSLGGIGIRVAHADNPQPDTVADFTIAEPQGVRALLELLVPQR